MSGTPLTDAINSLIVLANETTGKSDTTLSDAVESLIDGYGGGSAVYYTISYYNGETLLDTETVQSGGTGTYTGSTPTKSSTAQYTYAFAGWSKDTDDGTVDSDALTNVVADRNVYACFTATTRTYTVYWVNNGTTIETDTNVSYGTVPQYNGSTPTKNGQTSTGWLPDPTLPITGDTTFTAQYPATYTVTFKNDTGSTTLDTQTVAQGDTAVYGGSTPTSSTDSTLSFLGWATSTNSHQANAVLTNIQSDMIVYAAFEACVDVAEITDSWDTIIASIDNGTYATKYSIGNYKPLDLGTEGTINMQIVAMDADELANGNGAAPLIFLSMELLKNDHRMNLPLSPSSSPYTEGTGSIGGWSLSEMRTYLKNTVKPLIPSNVRSRINNVIKYSKTYNTGGEQDVANNATSIDDVWIPSIREISGTASVESLGPIYNAVIKDTSIRKKHIVNKSSFTTWWLRSANSPSDFNSIGSTGSYSYGSADNTYGICLGFCLGLEQETITDSWDTILANTNYATDYKIGDTKMIDLGSEGKHLMEIVGIDVDDRADGNGKAGLTWISKDLLNRQVMNGNGLTAGGWESSDLRSYLKETIKPLIPETIRNGIVEVTKIQSTVVDNNRVTNGQTTTEDVWIPSVHEIISGNSTYETIGAAYNGKFNSDNNRKKLLKGTACNWWTRSAHSSNMFEVISVYGQNANMQAKNNNTYIALGFCTN